MASDEDLGDGTLAVKKQKKPMTSERAVQLVADAMLLYILTAQASVIIHLWDEDWNDFAFNTRLTRLGTQVLVIAVVVVMNRASTNRFRWAAALTVTVLATIGTLAGFSGPQQQEQLRSQISRWGAQSSWLLLCAALLFVLIRGWNPVSRLLQNEPDDREDPDSEAAIESETPETVATPDV